jgi:GH18 family chitinase
MNQQSHQQSNQQANQQGFQQNLDESIETAQKLSHEARTIAQQVASAQVSAARAIFNLSNIWTLGSLTPLASRFEEGLGLYARTLEQVQDTTQQTIDQHATQYKNTARQGAGWASSNSQQPQSEQGRTGEQKDASRLYERQTS